MGKIRNLTICTKKIPRDMKLLIISDIHASKEIGWENLAAVKDMVNMDDINQIVIPGDIVNDVTTLRDQEFKEMLKTNLTNITQGKPTVVSYGNHDLMTKNRNGFWAPGKKELLKETLEELPHFHLVRAGKKINIDGLNYSACSPNFSYYENSQKSKKDRESTEDYTQIFYSNYKDDLFDAAEFNIFLTHEPQSIIKLSEEKGACIQPNTDMVVSGHMHNGLLPNLLQKFARNHGIISPQMQLFPKYAQGINEVEDTTFIINGPINTRIETPFINKIYGPNATVVTLKKTR